MKRNGKVLPIAAAFLCVFCLALVTSPSAQDTTVCIPIHAKISARWLTCDDSPIGLCTTGEITKGGVLNGTTYYIALGSAAHAGMPSVEEEATLSYAGTLTITTKHGTLELTDVGVFDQAIGVFGEFDRVVGGSGIFDGASGMLFIYGYSTPDGSGFEGDIRGEVCLKTAH